MPLVLLIGGARSGKSRLAVQLAGEQAAPVVVIATAEARDAEMAERIERHRRERPTDWQTLEEPLRLRDTIEQIAAEACLIVDCLTLWTANALENLPLPEVEAEAAAAANAAALRAGLTVAVTNEVGLGLVPTTPLGREYRDLLGRVNALWAAAAERVFLVVAGRALPLERPAAMIGDLGG